MAKRTILVTGGAGYIGSHVVARLGERGDRVIVLDNLSTGFADSVLSGTLIVGDTGDREKVFNILRDNRIDTVFHFAAHTIVPESVKNPLKYYRNNTASTRTLLESCDAAGVKHFVFSSTAAVYGTPDNGLADEQTPTQTINPYGTSKLMSEWMIRDLAQVSDMRYAVLRYFNVAGSDSQCRIGQSNPQSTLLVKVACQAALGLRPHVSIYGTDYPTPDGTGIRDYIHVDDLAEAHLSALDYLSDGGDSVTLNCGYGHGYSVREVLETVQRVNGAPLPVKEEARRPGDPPALIAATKRIRSVLDWEPHHDDLDHIVSTSLAWEKKLAQLRQGSARAAK